MIDANEAKLLAAQKLPAFTVSSLPYLIYVTRKFMIIPHNLN